MRTASGRELALISVGSLRQCLKNLISLYRAQGFENESRRRGSDPDMLLDRAITYKEAVLDSMADGLVTVDFDHHITLWNRAAEEITGWKSAQVMGKNFDLIFAPRDEAARTTGEKPTLSLLKSYLAGSDGEVRLQADLVVSTPLGPDLIVDSIRSLLFHGEIPVGEVVVFHEVTERRVHDEMKEDFITALAHDLRNPLATIKGYTTALRHPNGVFKPDETQEVLQTMDRELDRVERLLDNLVELARMEAGKLLLNLGLPVDLEPMIRAVVALHVPAFAPRPIAIHIPPALPPVVGDADRIERVLNNLVGNAIKYSPPGSSISIEAQFCPKYSPAPPDPGRSLAPGPVVAVSVSDQGNGIAAQERERIFERFHRAGEPEFQATRGSGLGLYISRKLVEAMGGRIWADSFPGLGTCFTFTLPAHVPPTRA